MYNQSSIELEKKFLVNKNVADYLKSISQSKKMISQTYLYDENASVIFNGVKKEWLISLFYGKEKVILKIKETDSNSDILDYDELVEKGSARIRVINETKFIFTFKMKNEDGLGDFEFEHVFYDTSKDGDCKEEYYKVMEFMENNKTITKTRYDIPIMGLKYELDEFHNISFGSENKWLLEVEFKTEEEYNNFKPIFESMDVTGISVFSNKSLCRNL